MNEELLLRSNRKKERRSVNTEKNITLDVDGDTDGFDCELLFDRNSFEKRVARGASVRDEWNSFCEWPKLRQVYGKMSGSDLTALSAPKVLGTSPEMTYWAYNILMVHRSEITGYKRSKVEDARLGRETGVVFDQRLIHWVLHEAKKACAIAQSPHWVL